MGGLQSYTIKVRGAAVAGANPCSGGNIWIRIGCALHQKSVSFPWLRPHIWHTVSVLSCVNLRWSTLICQQVVRNIRRTRISLSAHMQEMHPSPKFTWGEWLAKPTSCYPNHQREYSTKKKKKKESRLRRATTGSSLLSNFIMNPPP